ncbi:hypothetical protein AMTR_s00078p00064410 [Amborella trichopoda]|uniref:Uncharacterized protein n=1 Tax=Amborella trichopoda TaxID=13333 RepID=W1P7W6_AMBTC|nr:hypothetical protein AMTR_s00078p00064410 [Amborella trichopoda]
MERMVFSLILVSMVFSLSNSTAIKPHVVGSLKIKDKQAIEREEVPENTCSYTVKIKTSCSSVSYGQDGWRPEWVKIYKPSSDTPVTFYYDEFIPFDVWYGFNLCSSTPHPNNGGALSSSK